MEELVAELTHLARRSPGDQPAVGRQRPGVVANAEVLEAAALKRAVRLGEPVGAPRVSDLGAVVASTVGKVELESSGDDAPEERIVERLITKALHTTFTSPRLARRAGRRGRSIRGRVHGRDGRSDAGRASTWPGCARCPGWRTRSARPRRVRRDRRRRGARGVALAVEFRSRASIWRGGSTRTASPAGRSTTGDRLLPGSTPSGARPPTRAGPPPPPWGDPRGRRAGPCGALFGTAMAASTCRGPRGRRDPPMPSPTTSWPRATWPKRSAA